MIEQLFFELIRVAIGTQGTLSRLPSKGEWAELYAMAKKQSLVGICFAAVQKLQCNDNQEFRTQNPQSEPTPNQEPITPNLDEVQYLTWMGMAAKIQQRNEVVNAQCFEVQQMIEKEGFRTFIMKGQGNSALYRTSYDNENVLRIVHELGLDAFASALMWVLGHVFGLQKEYMLWEPCEKDGWLLLEEILKSGNFGHQDETKADLSNKWKSFWYVNGKTFRFWRFDHWAWFWSPAWRVYHFCWRKIRGFK